MVSSLVSRPEIFCCVLVGRRSRSLMLFVGQIRVSEQKPRTFVFAVMAELQQVASGMLGGVVARPGHSWHLRQADSDGVSELAQQWVADMLGDLGQAVFAGGVPGVDEAAQRTLRLGRTVVDGEGLFGVGEVAQQMSVTGLMPGEVLPAGVEVVAVAVVHGGAREVGQDAVNGQVAVPAGGQLKVPTPRGCSGLFGRAPPPLRAWRIRNDSPSVTTTLLWCSSRSKRLTAVVCSGRNRPHCSKGQCEPIPSARRS